MSEFWTSMTQDEPDALSKAARDPEVLSPSWDKGGRVHNWRNHVGRQAKRIWPTLTPEQRAALAFDADVRASDEEWD